MSHGNGLNVGMWAAALPHLQTRFRCFGIDLRGHGRSRPTRPDYGVARMLFAGDVVTAIDAIGEPVRFVGHSLGAAASVYAAIADSSPFVALWLFEPVLIPVGYDTGGDGPSFLIAISRKRRMTFDSVDDAHRRFMSKPPYSGCDPVAVRGYVEVGTAVTDDGVRLTCRGEDEARVYESGEPIDFATLAVIDRPVVVASGAAADEANALPPKLAPVVAQAIPGARWEEYEGLSHFGPMEDPAAMARSITEHFTTIDP
ncbi:MAG: alpha/beta fold hydrolase [Actinomycetota bacterium]